MFACCVCVCVCVCCVCVCFTPFTAWAHLYVCSKDFEPLVCLYVCVSGSFSQIMWGVVFHCLRCFSFFPLCVSPLLRLEQTGFWAPCVFVCVVCVVCVLWVSRLLLRLELTFMYTDRILSPLCLCMCCVCCVFVCVVCISPPFKAWAHLHVHRQDFEPLVSLYVLCVLCVCVCCVYLASF